MTPDEVKSLPSGELPALASRLRRQMLESVSRNGGHLASSLGAVELAIALVRVFDPAKDRVLWDVGHQAYAWKLLTGRDERFDTLRRFGGISGFPNPEESPCDAFVAGHAGAALAAAEGLAVARDRLGGKEHVVAVVGDAALANGMALEALNDCAKRTERLVLVVNDNGSATSVAPLGALLESAGFGVTRRIDGHDIAAMEDVFAMAKAAHGPIAVRVTTVKGKGFPPAEADPTAWHGVGPFEIGGSAAPRPASGWSDVFGAAVCAAARRDSRICALTAAMREGTGLLPFASEFPDRFFDVGICEEHLVTFAAGLAKGGMRPVVAVYSTFLQRAVDQVMHDVCLMNLPVVFGVDRAGAVGADGRTHHGMFDIPMLRCLPNLSILQPKDAAELAAMVDAALTRNAPTAIRYPRGVPRVFKDIKVFKDVKGVKVFKESKDVKDVKDFNGLKWGKAEQISSPDAPIQLWALGDQVAKALDVAALLEARGVLAGIVNARFVKPFDADLLARQRSGGARIVSLENGAAAGGFGEAIGADMRFGWPDEFVAHGSVAELEAAHGLTAEAIAESILRDGPFEGNGRP